MLHALLATLFGSYPVDEAAYRRHRQRIGELLQLQARIAEAQFQRARFPYLSPAEREFLEGSHAGRH